MGNLKRCEADLTGASLRLEPSALTNAVVMTTIKPLPTSKLCFSLKQGSDFLSIFWKDKN